MFPCFYFPTQRFFTFSLKFSGILNDVTTVRGLVMEEKIAKIYKKKLVYYTLKLDRVLFKPKIWNS
jgi:hypothetical protein